MVCAVPRNSVAKWPDIGATSSTRGWPLMPWRRKCSSEQNGVRSTTSSVTGTGWPATVALSMPKAGRWCVRRPSATISQAARSVRTASKPLALGWAASVAAASSASVHAGSMMSA
ncbi:hypothetical protein D3C81_1166310 [compost metagenome]